MENTATNKSIELASATPDEVKLLLSEMNEPSFRAKQIVDWLSRGARPDEMLNIPKSLREKLNGIPLR